LDLKFIIHTMSHDQVIDLIRLLDKVDSSRTDEVKHLLKSAELGVKLTVDKVRRSRSRQQENYYRKWVNEFAKWCGLTHDEMHEELLCRAYGSEEINTKFGFKRRPIKRSGEANREKYSELIDTLIITAAEMGFAIPEPNDGE
tara:strand:+ start:369 stop:797 length:429 start_codon:yes stop_codon:yes gene_type:complete